MQLHTWQSNREVDFHPPNQNSTLYPEELAFNDTNSGSSSQNNCFALNSRSWLSGKRLGNAQVDEEFVFKNILSIPALVSDFQAISNMMHQTLCHKNSKFLSLGLEEESSSLRVTDRDLHFWSLRLLYLAVHIHQHKPALEEAQWRHARDMQCQTQLASQKLGNFDFECPSTKFLVVSMGRLGLGAVMRLGVVNALIAGVTTNRTVLFVNNSPVGPKFIREPWLMASCPRLDMQCFYLPMTPCVLTREDIANATSITRKESRTLFKDGVLPDNLVDEKVLFLDVVLRPQRTPPLFREKIVSIVRQNILEPAQGELDAATFALIEKATNHILMEEEPRDRTYYYFGHNNKHNHAFVFYAMRPNKAFADRITHIIERALSPSFDPDTTIGLPIRASDKCDLESECMPFPQYMNLTTDTWSHYVMPNLLADEELSLGGDSKPSTNVIVTSEASAVLRDLEYYRENRETLHEPLPFLPTFITNEDDMHQNTGNPDQVLTNTSADDIMLSAISSLKLQMHAGYTVANCCSNFHLLLLDFLKDGCGAATNQVAQCMQDHKEPKYRLCCSWSKTDECNAKRNVSNSTS